MAKPFDITQFPLEIFEIIATFLDSSSYVEYHLEDDPEEVFTTNGEQIAPDARLHHLKNASLVCRRWHTAFQPIVFRHLFVRLSLPELSLSTSDLAESCAMIVGFMEDNRSSLSECVHSVTLFINDNIKEGYRSPYEHFLDVDNGRIAIVASQTVESEDTCKLDENQAIVYDPFTEFWVVLKHLMPNRVTLIGLDSHLAFYLPGFANYEPLVRHRGRLARLRLFSVSRNSKEAEESVVQSEDRTNPPNPAQKIMSIRCWNDVLLNEGSELRGWPDEDGERETETRKGLYGLSNLSLRASLERCVDAWDWDNLTPPNISFFASVTYVCQFGCYAEIAETFDIRLPDPSDGLFDTSIFRIRTLPHNLKLARFLESPLARRVGPVKVREFYRHRFPKERFVINLWNELGRALEGYVRIEFLDFENRAWKNIASQTMNARWIRPRADRPGYVALT
ncbi:hypothetical protein LIA77_08133 [Sarocladium implicatum]|nr:hypothetical protein LIA77_08133 [Sarocladium implicatum]